MPDASDAERASEALVEALREAHEIPQSCEFGEPLANMLWFCDDMLDIMAEHVERPNVGEGERGAFMGMRERVAALRAQLAGSAGEPGRPGLLGIAKAFEVFPFRYRDSRTGKWVRGRYQATPGKIAARYAEWELTGPGVVRRPSEGYFNPIGRNR